VSDNDIAIPSGEGPVTRADLQRLMDQMRVEVALLRRELLNGQNRQQWINAGPEPQRCFEVAPAGFPVRERDACAFSINDDGDNPAEVFIRNISLKVGDAEVLLPGPYSIVVDENNATIYFEYDMDSSTGEILQESGVSVPDSDNTYIRKALYTVIFEAATADHPARVTGYSYDWCHQAAMNTIPGTSGKSEYMALTLDSELKPVWDWIKFNVPS
jgi:hypothetical protein